MSSLVLSLIILKICNDDPPYNHKLLTDKGHNQNAQEDSQGVTEDMHQHDGDESDGEVELTHSLLILSTTQNLKQMFLYYTG